MLLCYDAAERGGVCVHAGRGPNGMGGLASPIPRAGECLGIPSRLIPHPPVGSPAHAGIDPWQLTFAANAVRFPRTRGDRPLCWVVLVMALVVPPHTRG